MSYSVTGIQAQTLGIPATEHTGGGATHSPLTRTTVDHEIRGLSTDSAKVSSDSFKASSTSHTTAPSKTTVPVDTVTLSTVDKVRNLREQGEGATLIATTLNLPLKEVDSDLHVATPTQHLSFTVAPVSSALNTNTVASSEHTISASA